MAKHILIVDDEADFRFSASIGLRQAGYEVSEAEDGEDGFRQIMDKHSKGKSFDLVVLDIQMPHMSGIEVFGAIRDHGIEVPIVFISGYADDEIIKKLPDKGYNGLLHKPFETEQLLSWVELMVAQ